MAKMRNSTRELRNGTKDQILAKIPNIEMLFDFCLCFVFSLIFVFFSFEIRGRNHSMRERARERKMRLHVDYATLRQGCNSKPSKKRGVKFKRL